MILSFNNINHRRKQQQQKDILKINITNFTTVFIIILSMSVSTMVPSFFVVRMNPKTMLFSNGGRSLAITTTGTKQTTTTTTTTRTTTATSVSVLFVDAFVIKQQQQRNQHYYYNTRIQNYHHQSSSSSLSTKCQYTSSSSSSILLKNQQQHYQYPRLQQNLHMSTETETETETESTSDTNTETIPSITIKTQKIITRRILSGVQPTGSIHLGNYLGAIRQWVDYQNNGFPIIDEDNSTNSTTTNTDDDSNEQPIIQTENLFCVVDLHAITMPHDPAALYESTLSSAALYLAAGIDPTKSKVFVQSHVTEHSELTWLLNCITPMNWLERMIQYKDKSKKASTGTGEGVGVGLFSYPVLMAADIILYQASHVPVGEDQRQHLELTRDIVRKFNDLFCTGNSYKKRCKTANIPSRPVFIEPTAIIMKQTGRIMSLTDGANKMSKSDTNDNSRINILDSPETIRTKIKRCKTDEYIGIEYNNPLRPEATNLLSIYMAVTNKSIDETLDEVSTMTWGQFKPLLATAIINHLQPIQEKYYTIRANETYLNTILYNGAVAARAIASQSLYNTKIAMGFVLPTSTTTTTSTSTDNNNNNSTTTSTNK